MSAQKDDQIQSSLLALRVRCNDDPIASLDHDVLERKVFIRQLADEIMGSACDRGLVMALYGRWGSGKSSIKNLVIHELATFGEQSPYIIEFNPWEWEGGKLAEAFFRGVARAIHKADPTANGEKTAARFVMYATTALLTTTAGYATYTLQQDGIDARYTLSWLGEVGKQCLFVWGIIKALREGMSAEAEFRRKSLDEMKAMLATSLKALPKTIIVVIDDIDRLADAEIHLLFQLIKTQSDFPKLSFLVLCDREMVANTLGKGTSDEGDRFLRKIVRSGYNVPHGDATLILDELSQGLNILLTAYPAYFTFNEKTFADLFVSGCRAYFENLRDVKRFLTGLEFYFRTLTINGHLEINPVDGFVIELMRQFEPGLYAHFPNVRYALTGEPFGPTLEHDIDSRKQAITLLEDSARNPVAMNLLAVIFPRIAQIMKGDETIINGREEDARRALRVSHHKIYDRYFTACVPNSQLSEAALRDIIFLSNDREALCRRFRAEITAGHFGVMLDQLRYYRHDIAEHDPVLFIKALLDMEPFLPDIRVGPWGNPIELEVQKLIEDILRTLPETLNSKDVIRHIIGTTTSLVIPIGLLYNLDLDFAKTALIQREDLTNLRIIGAHQIADAADNGTLAQLPMHKLIHVLHAWARWDSNAEREWAEETIADDTARLLATLQYYYQPKPRPFSSFDLDEMNTILPVRKILDRLSTIDLITFAKEDMQIITEFIYTEKAAHKQQRSQG